MTLISELGQDAGRADDGSRRRLDRPACDGLEGRHFVAT
jgi:hypothetical protein